MVIPSPSSPIGKKSPMWKVPSLRSWVRASASNSPPMVATPTKVSGEVLSAPYRNSTNSSRVLKVTIFIISSCVERIIHIVQTRVNTLEKKFLDFFYTANIVPFFLSLYLTTTYIKFCGLKCT